MVANYRPKWTVAEYLAYEGDSEFKHEYIDGEIYAMTGGTGNHSEIKMNTAIAIGRQLDDSNCSLRNSDMRVRVSPSRYVYPDMSAVCGKASYDDNSTTLLNPILVVEVTSPSSMDYDRLAKRHYYQAVPSIQGVLIIDQHRVFAELHTRKPDGWLWQQFSDLDAVIPLEMLDCTLPLAQVYRGILFEDA